MLCRTLTVAVLLMCLLACSREDAPATAAAGPAAMFLTIDFDAIDGIEGWVYSYGLSWVPCETPDAGLTRRFSLIGSAHASHPVVYEGNGAWAWHTPLPIGPASSYLFERRLDPGRYCGLVWLFSHGGVPFEGELGSIQLSDQEGVFARAHHAASVPIAFPEPICQDGGIQTTTIRFRTSDWVDRMRQASSVGTTTRDAWRTFRDFVDVIGPGCP